MEKKVAASRVRREEKGKGAGRFFSSLFDGESLRLALEGVSSVDGLNGRLALKWRAYEVSDVDGCIGFVVSFVLKVFSIKLKVFG